MAKIYYCDSCRQQYDWPVSRGRKKETRCGICNEPAQCSSGDTAFLPAKKSAGVQRATEQVDSDKPRPDIRRKLPEGLVKQKVLQVSESEDVPSALPTTPRQTTTTITAELLRKERDKILSTRANVIVTEVLDGALKNAVVGHYPYSWEDGITEAVQDKVKEELNARGLEIEPTEEGGINIKW